ncbi:MAG: serine/threonine-protein kinase [Polyangia bacterium]
MARALQSHAAMSGTVRSGGSSSLPANRLLGQIIGSYRIGRVIGRGGMGEVFEGVHIHVGRKVAIKIVHAQLAKNPQVTKRILTEARAAGTIDHPGVVSVLEVGCTGEGLAYIVMEYLDGVPLSQRIGQIFRADQGSDGRASAPPHDRLPQRACPPDWLPPQGVFSLRIASQLASTLCAIHQKGIIHRDLKPDNVFLVSDPAVPGGERAKIFDFGIAKLLSVPNQASESPIPGLAEGPRTALGTVLGTPVYMAPEQWRGLTNVDQRVDVYALGEILFELCCGRPPFGAQSIGELMRQHLSEAPPRLEQLVSWAPLALAELIDKMLAKDPGERPTMEQVANTLARLTDEQSGKELVPPRSAPESTRPESSMQGSRRSPLLTAPAPLPPPELRSNAVAATIVCQPVPTVYMPARVSSAPERPAAEWQYSAHRQDPSRLSYYMLWALCALLVVLLAGGAWSLLTS